MRTYLNKNVFDVALDRVRRLYDEFPQICVAYSGGKDSTVILNLCRMVAAEKKRGPVNVMWIDQEAEWENVVNHVRDVMHLPDVKAWWFQGPFKLFNATTTGGDPWLHCWDESKPDKWVRPKEPDSIHVNQLGSDRFKEMFASFGMTYFGSAPFALIGGVRCEESPGRMNGLTSYATYKEITWGAVNDKKHNHYTFYPIYDWSYTDVWKAIHDNKWSYCKLYDLMWQQGYNVREMRVSNVHHETAIGHLQFLQEIEPKTWNRICDRVSGVNAVKNLREGYSVPAELPYMFTSWREYRDHLLKNLIAEPDIREKFAKQFRAMDKRYKIEDPKVDQSLVKVEIAAILVNDYEGTKIQGWIVSHPRDSRGYGSRPDEFTGSHAGVQWGE